MPFARIFAASALGCAWLFSAPAPANAAAGDVPDPATLNWNLRDHYTFKAEDLWFIYGADNSQWALQRAGGEMLIDKAGGSVTFGDGRTVETTSHGVGDTTRRKYTGELGEGMEYIVTLPAKDGISFRHSVSYHAAHPFYLIRLEVKNEGDKPIEIARISTVTIPPGSLSKLGPQTSVHYRKLAMQGRYPVYWKDGAPLFALVNDPASNFTLAIGGLPTGQAETAVELKPFSGAWQGQVASTFSPPVRVEPGQTLQGEPVWLSFTLPLPADVDLYYVMTHQDVPRPSAPAGLPASWVTVEDGESFSALQQAAARWSANGVQHVLVPVTWEGKPGSLDGASPDWPRDMKSVAAHFRQSKLTPGITVDPLEVQGGDSAWSAVSEDGQRWLDPRVPEAFEYGVSQMRKVASWGFAFYAVEPSRIPNEVLKHFNISRARADALAFDIMVKAAQGAPVAPASRTTLGAERDAWLDAASATARMREYALPVGAIRFDASKTGELSDETATAMAFCGAPLEFVGNASNRVGSQLKDVIGKPHMWTRPLDTANPAPKLWQAHLSADGGNGAESLAIVSFEGARASTPDDLKTLEAREITIWRADAAGFLKAARKSVPTDRRISR